jgi:hypothetical protein
MNTMTDYPPETKRDWCYTNGSVKQRKKKYPTFDLWDHTLLSRILPPETKSCEVGNVSALIREVSSPQVLRGNSDGTYRLVGAAFSPLFVRGEGLRWDIPEESIKWFNK